MKVEGDDWMGRERKRLLRRVGKRRRRRSSEEREEEKRKDGKMEKDRQLGRSDGREMIVCVSRETSDKGRLHS